MERERVRKFQPMGLFGPVLLQQTTDIAYYLKYRIILSKTQPVP